MSQKRNHTPMGARSIKRSFSLVLASLVLLSSLAIGIANFSKDDRFGIQKASAATSSNLNFQARLLTSSGNTVPDGFYNLEFKLYQASAPDGGETPISGSCATNPGAVADEDCLWYETYYDSNGATAGNDNRIRVVNGYFSVNLGSQIAFPTTIDWDQDIWLSMNVGGSTQTATPTFDGEMSPRVKLTAVPYAFQAKQSETLVKTTGGGGVGTVDFGNLTADRKYLFPDTSLATTASPGTICVFNGAASNCPASSGSAYYIQNDTVLQLQSNFHIQARDSGVNGTVGAIIRGAAAGQTADLFQLQASNGTILTAFNASGALVFGPSGSQDTNLFRDSANVLRTNDALTVDGLLTGSLGAAISGAAISLNVSSNFNTNINTGTSTGAVSIGNSATSGFSLESGTATTNLFNGATAHTINFATGAAVQTLTIGSTDTTSSVTLQAGSTGAINLNGPTVNSNATSLALFGSSTTIDLGAAASTFNIGPGGATATSINLAGGSAATGCTVDGATGNLTCAGSITGSSTGTVGYFSRSGTTLQPATAGDNIQTTSGGTITSSGNLVVGTGATSNSTLQIIGNTSFPTPTGEGHLFYHQTNNQMYVYDGTRWQADRTTATKIVAASDSQNKEKADYVSTGTNDQDTINSAINALPATGGIVYLLEGTYNVDDGADNDDRAIEINKSNVTLTGSGSSTVIKLADIDADIDIITDDQAGTIGRLMISNLKVDGNKTQNTAGTQNGIIFSGVGTGTGSAATPGVKIEKVWVEQVRSNGIEFSSSSNNSIINSSIIATGTTTGDRAIYIGTSSQYNTVTGNTVQGNTGSGIHLNLGGASNTISGNVFQGNGSYGIFLGSNGNTVVSNTVAGNTDSGIRISIANNNLVSSNTVSGNSLANNSAHGIDLSTADNNMISNNRIISSGGTSGTSTGSGIDIGSNSDSNNIVNNNITDTFGTGYAISLSSSTSSNYLADNIYSGTGAASINDASTTTIYAGQLNSNNDFVLQGATRTLTQQDFESTAMINTGYGGIGQFGNLLTYSEQFDNAAWVKTNTTITATNNTAPDNQLTAETLDAGAGSPRTVIQTSGTAVGSTYTFSVWLKSASANNRTVLLWVDGSSGGAETAKTITVTPTWQRFYVTQNTATFTGSVQAVISGSGSTDDIHAWGAQLIAGSSPGAYVRSTASTIAVSSGVVSNGGLFVSSIDQNDKPLIVQAAPSQTANLMELQSSTGTVLASFSADGGLTTAGDIAVNGGDITSSAATFNLISSTTATNINIGTGLTTGTIALGGTSQTGTLTVGQSTASNTINIGNATIATGNTGTINIGTSATGTGKTVTTIGSTNDASSVTIQAGTGNINLNAAAVNSSSSTIALFGTPTTINLGAAASTFNIGPGSNTATSINLAGGSANTGCTVDGVTGDLTCSGNITGASTGTAGYWSRTGTTLQPATAGDNIQTTSSGTITSAGLLTGNAGLTITGAAINLNVSSNFGTNINTGTSTGSVAIGNSLGGSITLQSGSQGGNQDIILNSADTIELQDNTNVTGVLTTSGHLVVGTGATSNSTLQIIGNTSFPTPTGEGHLFYHQTNNQMYVYDGTRWQGDRTTATKIVAASNSLNKEKADYVADGNTGAAGDGDQIEINQAITAVNAAGGGTVYLLEGTYTIDATIAITSNINLVGSGTATIVTIPNAFNSSINFISESTNPTNIKISNMRLNGNGAQQSSGTMRGISLSNVGSGTTSTGATIHEMVIDSFDNEGVYLDDSSNNIVSRSTLRGNSMGIYNFSVSDNNTFSDNIVEGNTVNGIEVFAGTNITVTGNLVKSNGAHGIYTDGTHGTFSGNTVQSNTQHGIRIQDNYQTVTGNTFVSNGGDGISALNDNHVITGNNSISNTGNGIYLFSAYNNVSGNTVTSNTADGIHVNGSYNNITSNKVHNSGGDGIELESGPDYSQVIGNSITDTTGTGYPIFVNNTDSIGNYLADNTFSCSGCTTTGGYSIRDTGTGTIFGGQLNGNNDFVLQGATRTLTQQDLESNAMINTSYGGIGQFGNLLKYSEQFDEDTNWVKTGVTDPTANTIVAPDLQTSAETLVGTNNSNVTQTYTTTTNGTYTFSVWLKSASTVAAGLRIDSTGATPTTGTVKAITTSTAWTRYYVTQTFTGTPSNIKVVILPGNGATGTVQAWGAQLIAGSSPGAYVRSTASTIATSTGVVSNGGLFVSSINDTDKPLIVQAAPGQTANLFEIQNTAGGVLASFAADGALTTAGDAAINGGDITSSAATFNLISSTTATNINIGTGLTTGTITLGGTAQTGTITVGQSTASHTINIGNATIATGNTGTINIGTSATGTGKTVTTIGSTNDASSVTIQAGTGNINLNASQVQFTESASTRTITAQTRTTNAAGTAITISGGTAGSGGTGFSGGTLTLQGGAAAGSTSANGGAVTIIGGTAVGSGSQGLVNLSTTAFSSASVQTFASPGVTAITAGNVDLYSTLPITASVTGVIVTVPDPNQTVSGRLVYITARSGSSDFTLRLNSTRTPIDIAMKANSTATLIWNGTDWTAAGASSSTDLQSAYNNTLTSAGGAELVLNAAGGAADGLTIRNNSTTPISGGILEVQSSIGTNLFSVNNLGTELAANGGSETSATFATNWTAAPSGGTASRTTTAGQFVTGLAAAQAATTGTNHGIRNNLSGNPATGSVTYQVSFTAKASVAITTNLQVQYSPDGGSTLINCANYSTQSLSTSIWTKITCTITTDATAVTNPDLIIRQTDATSRNIWVDNLSFMRNDSTTQPSNVQIGGGINGGPVTLFTLDRSTAPPVANGDTTYLGSMYYDITTGRIQCYEADGWGACGSAPDNIITLTPEYSGAVLNGTGVGTLTADFCANQAAVLVVGTLCSAGEARNFYRWTSPQATTQTYSIYVTYKLPSTFKTFNDANTMKLTAYKDHATNAAATMDVFRKNVGSGSVSQCGSTTTIATGTNAWNTTSEIGDETACGFVGGDYVIFKINVSASNSANVYIENLDFTYTNN